MPIILKGILDPADARLAAEHAIDGIVGSNHGGRQVDGEIGALDALPGIVEAVGDRVTVLFDSGVRSGADVYKALALGARAVLLARPFIAGAAPHMYPGDCIGQADSPICTSAHGSDRLMSSG